MLSVETGLLIIGRSRGIRQDYCGVIRRDKKTGQWPKTGQKVTARTYVQSIKSFPQLKSQEMIGNREKLAEMPMMEMKISNNKKKTKLNKPL